MRRTRIKVCGMREKDQVHALIDMGVDAIGMIFYDKSPRNVSIEKAIEIRNIIPAFVDLVGVFVDKDVEEINSISADVGLNRVQLHGDQTADFASSLRYSYIKVIRVKNTKVIAKQINEHPHADAYLLDTYNQHAFGGTGEKIPEEILPNPLPEKSILAGGLNGNNIKDALLFKPFAVDINSGVEISPGNKDVQKVKKMIQVIRKFDDDNC